jgi:hypothetical protein
VELAPQDVEVKLIRGLATQHLPTFLQRLKQSEEDIHGAAELAVAWVNQGKLERELAAAALHQDGVICLGQADLAGAAEAWRAAVAISPDTPSGRQAAWRLDRLEKSVGKKP